MAKTKIKCNYCKTEFLKDNREINRNKRIGRNNYCNSKCAAQVTKANLNNTNVENRYDISKHSSNKLDKFSPFRFIIKTLKNDNRKDCHITIYDLEKLWNKQKGICPIVGIKMILPNCPNWRKGERTNKTPYNASVDRIDNSRPYEVGNIRFICLMANYARNTFSDKQLIDFCHQVTQNQTNK